MNALKIFARLAPEFHAVVMSSCIRHVINNDNSFSINDIIDQVQIDDKKLYNSCPRAKLYIKTHNVIKKFVNLNIIFLSGKMIKKNRINISVGNNLYSFNKEYL